MAAICQMSSPLSQLPQGVFYSRRTAMGLDQSKMPLLSALMAYKDNSIIPFDVPGHKQGKGNPLLQKVFGAELMRMDVNSSKPLDFLGNPTGVIKEAEELMAEAFDAKAAHFLVNGTSSGVQAMIMTACRPGEKIILPRNVHKSAINALILSGAEPIYLQPEIHEDLGIAMGISAKQVAEAIRLHRDAKAVFIIHPTYYGAVSELSAIVSLAHENNMLALVDEAHGTHFHFHPELPIDAMNAGADMAAVSLHKTGGSLSQSSALLIGGNQVDPAHVKRILNLSQTTSASYLLMASLDATRCMLATQGEARFTELLTLARETRKKLNEIPGVYAFGHDLIGSSGVFDFDETKMSIHTLDFGLSGLDAYDILRDEFSIQLEMGDAHNILAIFSVGDGKEDAEALLSAIRILAARNLGKHPRIPYQASHPVIAMRPRDAFYAAKESLLLNEAEDEIAGESIMAYPPGIPIVSPGEKIDRNMIRQIQYLKQHHCVLTGTEDPDVNRIQVVKPKGVKDMDLWFSEYSTKDTKFSIRIEETLYSAKSAFQRMDFYRSKTFGTFFTLDGYMMVNERDEFIYHDMIAHVPMAVNPAIKRVLVIGGGDGGAVRELTRYSHVQEIHMVEIDEMVVRACQKYLPQTAGKLNDPRVTLFFEDGVAFLKDKTDAYDLILVDSTDPIGPGEGLFTEDFYRDCLRALSENGILINQHESPYFEANAQQMKRAHAKIFKLFPISKVYQFHMPTYPSGHWLFGFASKKLDPIQDLKAEEWTAIGLDTEYYNTDLHIGAFMLPTYVKRKLEDVEKDTE